MAPLDRPTRSFTLPFDAVDAGWPPPTTFRFRAALQRTSLSRPARSTDSRTRLRLAADLAVAAPISHARCRALVDGGSHQSGDVSSTESHRRGRRAGAVCPDGARSCEQTPSSRLARAGQRARSRLFHLGASQLLDAKDGRIRCRGEEDARLTADPYMRCGERRLPTPRLHVGRDQRRRAILWKPTMRSRSATSPGKYRRRGIRSGTPLRHQRGYA